MQLDEDGLARAFEGRDDLVGAVRNAAAGPHYVELFNQITLHINSLPSSHAQQPTPTSEPASKKRRLGEENGLASRPANGISIKKEFATGEEPVLLAVKEISLLIPQRKKYTLCFTEKFIYARTEASTDPVAGCCWTWKDIEYAFLLPIPEKTQKQYAYILFPHASSLPPSKSSTTPALSSEPLCFSISDSTPKAGTISGSLSAAASSVSDDFKSLFQWAFSSRLKAQNSSVKIIEADPKLFHSEQRQPHRPNEKAVHVKAFRGSKDGYLFFLPNGILWGFKKPLLFLPHSTITSVAYTSVLQRTFNLTLELDLSSSLATNGDANGEKEVKEEIEFSMLDQEDFDGIDTYIKRHGLQDGSLAANRKAKKEGANVIKDKDGNVVGNLEAGELEKARLEAGEGEDGAGGLLGGDFDEEDEEEEDYDPGSEGESEGSGSSDDDSDGDDDGGGEGGDDDDEDDEE